MGKPVEMLSSLCLVLIIGELLISETSATYFIEVTDFDAVPPKTTLYECDNAPDILDLVRPSARTFKHPKTPLDPKTPKRNRDISCFDVNEAGRRRQIYAVANFYMVTNAQLGGNGRIVLMTRKGSRLAPSTILVGVKTVNVHQDFPALVDASKTEDATEKLKNFQSTALAGKVLDDAGFDKLAKYLNAANFDKFLNPSSDIVDKFMLYGKVVQAVEEAYTRDVRQAKQNKIDKVTQITTRQDVVEAVEILVQKLIDPCIILASTGDHNRPEATKEATEQCGNFCRFLAAGYSAKRVGSSECGSSMVGGLCHIFECFCERKNSILTIERPDSYVHMVKCNNELRNAITGAGMLADMGCTNLGSWAGFQKSILKPKRRAARF